MILALVLSALALAWLSQGHSLHPGWLGTLSLLFLWLGGFYGHRRNLLALGFLGTVALASLCALRGNLLHGLGVMGFGLLAWDYSASAAKASRRLLWSLGTVGSGTALGVLASFLRLSLNFWALMAGLIAIGWLLRAWTKEMGNHQGGETKGNRSASGPTK